MNLFQVEKHTYNIILKALRSKTFRYFVLFFIIGSITSIILSSYDISKAEKNYLSKFLWLSTIIFTIEYILRIFSSPALFPKVSRTKSRLKYLISFYGIVDFVAIIPSLGIHLHWGTKVAHLIMLPYIFIIFKLIRYSKSFKLLAKVFQRAKDELITAYTVCGIMICFSAILMYYIEHSAQPDIFRNIGEGFWWAVTSFTTIGYGDIYPITPLGKILSGIISLIGICMIALPTGIITASFMKMVNEKKLAAGTTVTTVTTLARETTGSTGTKGTTGTKKTTGATVARKGTKGRKENTKKEGKK